MPCGLNGALSFIKMPQDKIKSCNNAADAKYGTSYCDAKCPHDIEFIDGQANCEDWGPSASDPNAGVGKYGSYCAILDIMEANLISSAYTSNPCSHTGQLRCSGVKCGDDAKG